jgi:hypothetical protein
VLATPDGEAYPVDRRDPAIAYDEIGDLDARLAHRNSPDNRRVARNMMASATNTADVWMIASAVESSVEELSQALAIDGAMTCAFGPTRKIDTPSSRTLAMNSKSHVATMPGRNSGMVTVRSW